MGVFWFHGGGRQCQRKTFSSARAGGAAIGLSVRLGTGTIPFQSHPFGRVLGRVPPNGRRRRRQRSRRRRRRQRSRLVETSAPITLVVRLSRLGSTRYIRGQPSELGSQAS